MPMGAAQVVPRKPANWSGLLPSLVSVAARKPGSSSRNVAANRVLAVTHPKATRDNRSCQHEGVIWDQPRGQKGFCQSLAEIEVYGENHSWVSELTRIIQGPSDSSKKSSTQTHVGTLELWNVWRSRNGEIGEVFRYNRDATISSAPTEYAENRINQKTSYCERGRFLTYG